MNTDTELLRHIVELGREIERLEKSRPKLWDTHPAKLAFNKAALAGLPALSRLLSAQEGWQLVPKQWTSEMAHAGYMVHEHKDIACAECGAIYMAMLKAAPTLECGLK